MSRSQFFNPKATKAARPLFTDVTEEQYRQLHWTKQLELRPLGNRRKWTAPDIDSHQNRWDMDLEENITKETT